MAGFGASNTVVRPREVWQPPPFGHIKINVDASFVESLSAASVGVVARSCNGDIIVSSYVLVWMNVTAWFCLLSFSGLSFAFCFGFGVLN